MRKIKPFPLTCFILLLAMLACSTTPPVAPIQTVDLNTAIAQTAGAAMTQTALVLPPATETFTPLPTLTATLTETPTLVPTFTFTATVQIPMISVSVATNCRNGPGKVYGYEGALLVGQTVEILAAESTGNYWYIHNPETDEDKYCWVWDEYATIVGDTSILPIYTPPPTPTATLTSVATATSAVTATKNPSSGSFVVSYNNLDTCNTNWRPDFKLRNNGAISFQSFNLSIKDLSNNNTIWEKKSNVFTDLSGCNAVTDQDALDPGDMLFFSGPNFDYDPTGHNLRASLILCTGNGQKGTCIKQNFDFKP